LTVARTESLSIQVHPQDEQQQINFMQNFYWSLLGSQEIKNIDNRLERRGDTLYQVHKSEHYVKLVFSRDLEIPNLDKIKKLETEFFALEKPKFPKLFPIFPWWAWGISALFYGAGLVIWLLYFFLKYQPDKNRAERRQQQLEIDQHEILERLKQYDQAS